MGSPITKVILRSCIITKVTLPSCSIAKVILPGCIIYNNNIIHNAFSAKDILDIFH